MSRRLTLPVAVNSYVQDKQIFGVNCGRLGAGIAAVMALFYRLQKHLVGG